ncbi:hypothetical protein KUCAC02_030394 [Chaenocephalus aceratus]|uniref:Uncharacterized protein n=1 Tax=Chaenocephalus aceratus TaxID=36190 RepID=A0ACB9XKP3_CHAAC|nr:hypothetical protein KUCAC02_030394 [Chaenocephalus aceratus]
MNMELCWISIPTEASLLFISHKPTGERALENIQREKVQIVNTNMSSRQHLIAKMELVHTLSKLTPEERKVEVRRQMYVELKAVEMERRQRAALETLAKSERDGEETQKVTESLKKASMETDRRRQEAPKERRQNQLKQERLQWQQVILKGVKSPTHNFLALNEEQEKIREEADILTPDLKSPERKKKTLHNNWVAEKEMHSRLVVDDATYLLFAAKPNPKSYGKTAEVRETLQSMQKDRLSVGHWVGKYQQNHEKKREKRRLKAEAQREEYIASKSHGPQQSLLDELLDCKKVVKNKNVLNNWVAEEEMESRPDDDYSDYLLLAARTIPKFDGKTAEVRETLQSMQKDRLSVGHWVGKYQQNHKKKREKRRLKAEAQHEEYIASKSHGPQQSLLNELLDWSVC